MEEYIREFLIRHFEGTPMEEIIGGDFSSYVERAYHGFCANFIWYLILLILLSIGLGALFVYVSRHSSYVKKQSAVSFGVLVPAVCILVLLILFLLKIAGIPQSIHLGKPGLPQAPGITSHEADSEDSMASQYLEDLTQDSPILLFGKGTGPGEKLTGVIQKAGYVVAILILFSVVVGLILLLSVKNNRRIQRKAIIGFMFLFPNLIFFLYYFICFSLELI